MGKVRDLKFGVRIGHQACKPKDAKVGQKGLCTLCICEMGKVRNIKFGMWIDRQAYKPKKYKSRSKAAWSTSCDLLL